MGHSKAGTVALLYAAEFGDILNIVNIAGRFDMRLGLLIKFGDSIIDEIG